jgi:hypothetical protein
MPALINRRLPFVALTPLLMMVFPVTRAVPPTARAVAAVAP